MKRYRLTVPLIVLSFACVSGLSAHYFQVAGLRVGNHSIGNSRGNKIASTVRSKEESQSVSESTTRLTLDSAEVTPSPILPADGTHWYVAPDGKPTGKGTRDSPWNLATALAGGSNQARVKPGDTIWLRGGLYGGTFTSTLSGRPDAPIIIRQYPGERAIIDKGSANSAKQPALKVKGSWLWFWGFEIMNSYPDRTRKSPYSGSDEPWRGSGADVYASNVKFINMVFHDNGHGIWDKKDMTEIYGCLFYYNGNNKREHAMYIGNSIGTKYITDNIVFAQAGYGIHGYSGAKSDSQSGLYIEGNASFNNGILTLDDQTTGNIHVGGGTGVSAERITVKTNYVYNSPGNARNKNYGIRLGYEDTGNKDAKLLDNYIVSKVPLRVWWWQNLESRGNTIYSQGSSAEIIMPPGVSTSAYRWDFNTYLSGKKGGPTFIKDNSPYSFSSWQKVMDLDRNSQVVQETSLRPSGVKTFIRQNKYESGRASIVIYNWDLRTWVAVNVSSVLPVGASYEVRDAQNYFGEPVSRGTFDGTPIRVPMNMSQIAKPVGNVERVPSHTAPEFGVFVLRRTDNAASAASKVPPRSTAAKELSPRLKPYEH